MNLVQERELFGGVQRTYKFTNGFGASVVSHPFSYGGGDGLWEIAVLGKDGSITYDTPITSDVIGHLNGQERDDILQQIEALKE